MRPFIIRLLNRFFSVCPSLINRQHSAPSSPSSITTSNSTEQVSPPLNLKNWQAGTKMRTVLVKMTHLILLWLWAIRKGASAIAQLPLASLSHLKQRPCFCSPHLVEMCCWLSLPAYCFWFSFHPMTTFQRLSRGILSLHGLNHVVAGHVVSTVVSPAACCIPSHHPGAHRDQRARLLPWGPHVWTNKAGSCPSLCFLTFWPCDPWFAVLTSPRLQSPRLLPSRRRKEQSR